jgi:lysophospholipase L1-like esterase
MSRRIVACIALLSGCLVAFARQAANPFEPEIKAFEAKDAQSMPRKGQILFVGSSSIRLWKSAPTDFPEYKILNRGFGGSTIADSVFFANRIVLPYEPRMVVFFAGTNDLAAGKSPEQVIEDYERFVQVIHAKLPKTPVVYIGITPAPSRRDKWDLMKRVNAAIKSYDADHEDLIYVDVYDQFLTNGEPRPELFQPDKLHLNSDGYAIWVKALKPILATSPERNGR